MANQNLKYLKIIWILLFGVTFIVSESTLNIPNRNFVKTIKQHSEFNHDSYNFEYYFDDGTIATEIGQFEKIYAYGVGYFRFNIDSKLYEFQYESDAVGTRGVLTYLSPTGETIEESFFATTPEAPITSPVKLSDFHFGQFRLKLDFKMEAYFPSKDANRPAFSCEFYIKGEIPSFAYRTYETRTGNSIETTGYQAHAKWLAQQKKLKVEIVDYENHYDESGNYIIKYIFNNGLALCELGTLNGNSTVTVYSGHIILDFKDILFQWNYTGDATQYDVIQIIEDRRDILQPTGSHTETQFNLKATGEDSSLKTNLFSDGKNKFEAYREFTQVNGRPFIRAIIKCRIEYLGEMIFDLNESYAYGDPHFFENSTDE